MNANWRSIIILSLLFCLAWPPSLFSEQLPQDKVQHIIDTSTITRVQRPLAVRADRKTLEYFIDHVEELTKHGRDFNRKELILKARGNGRYRVQMPLKHITGEFELVERQPGRAVYLGHGSAATFFHFSGAIVLVIDHTAEKDDTGGYEEVKTSVHVKFDNELFALLAKIASPILAPKLDKLVTKFSTKIKKVVETAYANRKNTKCPQSGGDKQ